MNSQVKISLSVNEAQNILTHNFADKHNCHPQECEVTIEKPYRLTDYQTVMAVLHPLRFHAPQIKVGNSTSFKIAQIKILRQLIGVGLCDAKYIVEATDEEIREVWDKHKTFNNFTNHWRELNGIITAI